MKNQKANYFAIGIVILLCFIIFGFGGNYLKKQNKPSPLPIIEKKSTTDTSSWTTYTNKTFGYSIKFPETYEVPPQSEKQKNQLGVGNNIIVLKKGSNNVIIEINVYSDKDNMLLEDYMNNNLKTFEITGPLVKYNLNGYDSLFNKNQPGINVFVKQGQYVYHITASTASSDKEVGDIVASFSFITKE